MNGYKANRNENYILHHGIKGMKCGDLKHYGVKGMRWGVRRYQNADGTLTSAGKVRYGSARKYELKYKSPALRNAGEFMYRLAFNIAARIPVIDTLILALGTIDTVKNVATDFDVTNYYKKEGPPEKLSEMKKQNPISTDKENLIACNPGKGKKKGTANNCGFCTATMEMRARGYDVRARRKAMGMNMNEFGKWFEGFKLNNFEFGPRGQKESRKEYYKRSYDKLCQDLEKYGNGSRGCISIMYEKMNVGHVFNWKVENNRVIFLEGQVGRTVNDSVFSFADPQSIRFARLDNLALKPDVAKTCVSIDYKKGKGGTFSRKTT